MTEYRWVDADEKRLNKVAEQGWTVVPGTVRKTCVEWFKGSPEPCEVLMQRTRPEDPPPRAGFT